MDLGLKGKTALVTGASRGIGREIARALHAEGVSVAIVARTSLPLQEAAQDIMGGQAPGKGVAAIHPIVADLTLLAEVERVAHEARERLGRVDILVNNAGSTHTGDFFKMEDGELEGIWRVKGLGYARLTRAIVPEMIKRRDGRIVNIIGSTARTPASDFIAGSMVNAALVNFTRGISRELAGYNIRVNAISPGWTMTDRQARSFEMRAAARNLTLEEIERAESRAIPLRRLVTPGEIAALAVLLVSDVLPAMTGEDIIIDGGAANSI